MRAILLFALLLLFACQPVIVQQPAPAAPDPPAVTVPTPPPAPAWTPAQGHIYFLAADGTVLRDYWPADYADTYQQLWNSLASYVFPTFQANNPGATMVGGGP